MTGRFGLERRRHASWQNIMRVCRRDATPDTHLSPSAAPPWLCHATRVIDVATITTAQTFAGVIFIAPEARQT